MPSNSISSPKRPKKRIKYEQKYKVDYKDEFKCETKSASGDAFAFCTLCRSDVNISHGGRDDLRKHRSTQKHLNAASATKLQPSLSSFVAKDRTAEVTRAKLLFMSFLVEHNVALSASDHAGALFKQMFPDSELAKKYQESQSHSQTWLVSTLFVYFQSWACLSVFLQHHIM